MGPFPGHSERSEKFEFRIRLEANDFRFLTAFGMTTESTQNVSRS